MNVEKSRRNLDRFWLFLGRLKPMTQTEVAQNGCSEVINGADWVMIDG